MNTHKDKGEGKKCPKTVDGAHIFKKWYVKDGIWDTADHYLSYACVFKCVACGIYKRIIN
jgi:hypothetical protein